MATSANNPPSTRPGETSKDRPSVETGRDRIDREQRELKETTAKNLRTSLDPDAYNSATAILVNQQRNTSAFDSKSPFPKVELSSAKTGNRDSNQQDFNSGAMAGTTTRDRANSNDNRELRGGQDRLTEKLTDRLNVNDVPRSRDLAEARKNYLSAVRERDPRLAARIEAALPAMEKRILSQKSETGDGNGNPPTLVDYKEELSKLYDHQAYFAKNAEQATDSQGRPLITADWQVGKYLEDAINLARNPEERSNQDGPTCGLKQQGRMGELWEPGKMAEKFTQSYFGKTMAAVDPVDHKAFTTRVNANNFRPRAEDNQDWLGGAQGEGPYGRALTTMAGQLNAALIDREESRARGQEFRDHYSFDFVPPMGPDDSGIRIGVRQAPGEKLDGFMYGHEVGTEVVGRRRDGSLVQRSVLVNSKTKAPVDAPEMNQFTAGRNLQAFIGNDLKDPNFGKDNTFFPAQAGENLPFATSIHNAGELMAAQQHNKDRGRNCAYFFSDVRNLPGMGTRSFAGGGGGHATGLALNDNGTFKYMNQWDGHHNYDNVDARTALAWMQIPQENSSGSGGGGGRYSSGPLRYPEGTRIVADDSRILKYTSGPDKLDGKKPGEKLDDPDRLKREEEKQKEQMAEKEHEKSETALAQEKQQKQRQANDSLAQLIALEKQLNDLPTDSPLAADLKAQQQQLKQGLQTLLT